LTVAQLPATVRLDDSMAMTPALTLSSFDRVNVVARVSLKGSALASSGDFEGSTGPIDTTAERVSVAVVIDRQLP
jgi:cytochrome c-type biogenesis protein CcmH